MPTFVTLIEYNPEHEGEAIENVEERYEEAAGLVEAHGGEVKATYHGDIAGYDAMTITEFPDRESLDKTDVVYSMDAPVSTDVTEVKSHEEYVALVEETLDAQGE